MGAWPKGRGGFKCKYCREEKGGGGATRFKEHLAHRGKDVKDCPSVPTEVKEFFRENFVSGLCYMDYSGLCLCLCCIFRL